MEFYEIRNWFAHTLCDYLREGEESNRNLLEVAIKVIRGERVKVNNLPEKLPEEVDVFCLREGMLELDSSKVDPITEEYLREKASKVSKFLSQLGDFEPVGEDIEKNVEMARKLFDAGLYFEVHELLEEIWMGEFGKDRDFLQALIQIGVAYYHLDNYNRRGYFLLLENALQLLSGYSGTVYSVDVDELKERIKEICQSRVDSSLRF
ncbi:MAG: DUF309 domain-containing protein [Desulfurobacteriaceae bacterium]